jgi:hypothetical protein
MLRLASDENFDGYIVRRLLRQIPGLDLIRIQDTIIYSANDEKVLEWAATENRILLTHDLNTIPKHAYDRVKNGEAMPGIFAVPRNAPLDKVAEDLIILLECSADHEWENQVVYLPI